MNIDPRFTRWRAIFLPGERRNRLLLQQGGPPAQTVLPGGIASAEAHGAPKLNLQIQASGIASGEALGAPKLNLQIRANGIPSAEAFGAPKLNLTLTAAGIPSAEAIGTAKVNRTVTAAGIGSAESLGAPKLNLQIRTNGINSAEGFGALKIQLQIRPAGVGSDEGIGTATVLRGAVTLTTAGIASAEIFGMPALVRPTNRIAWTAESVSLPNMALGVSFSAGFITAESIAVPKFESETILLSH